MTDPRVFVDIIPINSMVPPVLPVEREPVAEDVFVTVYWRTPLDGFVIAGWPAPMWLVGNYDEMELTANESVRIWL